MNLSNKKLLEMYETMQKIRQFEFQTAKSFAEGDVLGFVHLYIGEEAIATGVCANLIDGDYITSTHRGHGHIIAKGAKLDKMMAELWGKETGYCKGKGGSMHIADTELGILGANGIVGGGFTLAAGAAFSSMMLKNNKVCVCFHGDGATAEGAFHEAMNIATLWNLPVVFVNENNLYAVSCRISNGMVIENTAERAAGYRMPSEVVDGNDILAVCDAANKAIDRARKGYGPTYLECKTYRWRGHFEGEPENYRNPEEVKLWKQPDHDPIPRFEEYLKDNGVATEEALKEIQLKVKGMVKDAVKFASKSAFPAKESALEDVYTDIVEEART